MKKQYIVLFLLCLWLSVQNLSSQQVLDGYDGYWVNKQILTIFDLFDFSPEEFGFLRNEIFARYGRGFKTEKYSDYFGRSEWYRVDPDYSDSWLTDQDRGNASLILSVERPRFTSEEMRRTILRNLGYSESEGNTVLTFLGDTSVSVMDTSDGMAVYMGNSSALDMKWRIWGDWVIVYDPEDPSQGIGAYLLDHDTRRITKALRKNMPIREVKRIISILER